MTSYFVVNFVQLIHTNTIRCWKVWNTQHGINYWKISFCRYMEVCKASIIPRYIFINIWNFFPLCCRRWDTLLLCLLSVGLRSLSLISKKEYHPKVTYLNYGSTWPCGGHTQLVQSTLLYILLSTKTSGKHSSKLIIDIAMCSCWKKKVNSYWQLI